MLSFAVRILYKTSILVYIYHWPEDNHLKFTKEIVETLNNFIIDQIPAHQDDILALIMGHFGLSKPTAAKYLNKLSDAGVVKKNGKAGIPIIFNEYTDPDKQPGFHKTAIPVQLLQYEGEFLMSRSQAKQLITRFDRFLEVVLDFTGVDMIGQGFADEIFRVFARTHPTVHLSPVNCSVNVQNMIRHVQGNDSS
jgi:hypothetical protein